MKILFLYSYQSHVTSAKPLLGQCYIHLGLSYISSLLQSHQHQVDVLVLTRLSKMQLIDQHITQFQPNVIGFTAVTTEYPFIKKIANYIKTKYPSLYLVIGGSHATLNPKSTIKGPFNALCIGEGEYPMLELVEQLEQGKTPHKISNLWIKTGARIEKNPTRPFIQDLSSLPFPNRIMWQKWIANHIKELSIEVGRGCPFNCTYCSNHALKKISPGKYFRLRPIDIILQEIEELTAMFPEIKDYELQTETMGVDFEYDLKLCAALEKFNAQLQNPLKFTAMLRIVPNKDFAPLFHALKKANFSKLVFGLESGSERLRRKYLRRHYSNADFIKIIRLAKQFGLKISTLNMIGFPGESLADFKETIQLNRVSNPEEFRLFIFFPYPGTRLYEICKEMNVLPSSLDTRMERRLPKLELPGFSKKQILKQYRWFPYHIYYGCKPRSILLGKVLSLIFESNPVLSTIIGRESSMKTILKKFITNLK